MMTQKSNEEIYKSLSEEERNVTVTSVELTDKAFKGKTDYSAIARLNGKVVFREGEYFSTLEGLQLFVFKNGKQITAYNWKIEDMRVSQPNMRHRSMHWETSWSGIKLKAPGTRTGKSWRSMWIKASPEHRHRSGQSFCI